MICQRSFPRSSAAPFGPPGYLIARPSRILLFSKGCDLKPRDAGLLISHPHYSREARWQSGHAAACKAVYAGSIPTLASRTLPAASWSVRRRHENTGKSREIWPGLLLVSRLLVYAPVLVFRAPGPPLLTCASLEHSFDRTQSLGEPVALARLPAAA